MENQNNTNKIIIGFFMIIVGVIIITTISNSSAAVTTQINIVNESLDISTARNGSGTLFPLNYSVDITVANNPTGWKSTDCPLTSFLLTNGSGTVLTDATDYELDETTGIINFYDTTNANMSGTSNTSLVGYTYCPDEYVNSAWGRSTVNLIAGFAALTLLGIGIALLYSVFRDGKIMN